MEFPSLSIVICTYNGKNLVKRLLDSIFEQDYNGKIEVICVDGGSEDGTLELLKKYKVKIHHNKARFPEGKGMGKYQGWALAKNELLLIVDQDNKLIGKDCLKELVKPLVEDKEIFGCACRLFIDKKDNLTNRYLSYVGTDPFASNKSIEGKMALRKIKLIDPDLGTWTYTYDLIGNLISQSGGGGNLVTGDSYYREYDSLGQLQRVKQGNTSSGLILEEYFYDANGDRIKANRYSYNGGTNETIYTPFREWLQIRNSSGTYNFYYIYDSNTLIAKINPDGTKWFYHSDHLGSTTLITDQNGNVLENEFYSPYGESLSANSDEKFKLFTGQLKDTVDQYYYGARYYKSDWAKFIQCDTVKFNIYNPQALNCYAYGLNNPYRFKDDSGNIPVDTIADIGFIAYDIYKLATEGAGEDSENLQALGADLAGTAIPYATGLGLAVRTGKAVDKTSDAIKLGGRLGGVEHRATVAKQAASLRDEGYEILAGGGLFPEKRVNIPGQIRYRYPDIIAKKNNQKLYVNIGRTTSKGKPVSREVKALNDLSKTGQKSKFVQYTPKQKSGGG